MGNKNPHARLEAIRVGDAVQDRDLLDIDAVGPRNPPEGLAGADGVIDPPPRGAVGIIPRRIEAAAAQKRQAERTHRPEACVRNAEETAEETAEEVTHRLPS